MKAEWKEVMKVIADSDIVLLLLDARYVDDSRNRKIENTARERGKPLIYVITKADLSAKNDVNDACRKLRPSVHVSVRDHKGAGKLRERILIEASRAYGRENDVTVGVLGYPNVGKSSLINMMKGKKSASTSSISGHTRIMQKFRADERILMLDSPGVIPTDEKDGVKHAAMGAVDSSKSKDPDLLLKALMEKYPGSVESYYGVPVSEDMLETLEKIAVKKGAVRKGGVPDTQRMARQILKKLQEGKIRT